MRVIIAGSRSIINFVCVADSVEDSGFEIEEVVSGGARGVDRLGEEYAKHELIPVRQFIPNWDELGKRAGFVRNEQMGDYADALIAIWDGESRGTKHMIDYMTKLNKKVYVKKI